MSQIVHTDNSKHNIYLAVRKEYIFKVDGNRPLLYPLDYINTIIYYLTPVEGLVLSLLNGTRTLTDISSLLSTLLPNCNVSVETILNSLDERVKQSPSSTGIGIDGLIQYSHIPIADAQTFDPRQFVVSTSDYSSRINDNKHGLRLDTPINIYTVFTNRCHAQCVYCYADRNAPYELPFNKWRDIIEEMRRLDIWMCSPDNGEIFARDDSIELLECMLNNDMHFLLSTKARVSKNNVKRLIAAGLSQKLRGVIQRRVQLSVDAVDYDVLQRLLGIKHPSIDNMSETFDNFYEQGIMPKVKAVITGINVDQPIKLVQHFYPRGARDFHFVQYSRSFHRHVDELFVEAEAIPLLRKQFDDIQNRYPDIELTQNLIPFNEHSQSISSEKLQELWNNRIGCGGGWYALGLSPHGKAFLCEQMKMDDEYFVGDICKQSLLEIWHSDEMYKFIYPDRADFKNTICCDCAEFEDCMWKMGRCYRDAYFSYGSVFEPPPLCPRNEKPGLRLS